MVIRSIVIDREGSTIGAGGGITALSVPEEELAEVMVKAAPLLRRARGGLQRVQYADLSWPTQQDERDEPGYDFAALQEKWLAIWDELKPFATDVAGDTRPRKYILDMFPYPSGDLHMGHAEAFAFGDIAARYWRQRGFNVLHPIGWDSFGLPAENAAIERGANPVTWTYENIEQQKASFRQYGVSFDWTRVLHTSDPEYYKWNQWLFLKMFEKGLAYRKDSLGQLGSRRTRPCSRTSRCCPTAPPSAPARWW